MLRIKEFSSIGKWNLLVTWQINRLRLTQQMTEMMNASSKRTMYKTINRCNSKPQINISDSEDNTQNISFPISDLAFSSNFSWNNMPIQKSSSLKSQASFHYCIVGSLFQTVVKTRFRLLLMSWQHRFINFEARYFYTHAFSHFK